MWPGLSLGRYNMTALQQKLSLAQLHLWRKAMLQQLQGGFEHCRHAVLTMSLA